MYYFLFSTLAAFAQTTQPTPPPTLEDERPINVKTDLVTLTLTVNDIYGRYVSGLTKEAFTIFDNNEEQEITFFPTLTRQSHSVFYLTFPIR